MAILVDQSTRLVVQGLTGSEGRFHGLRNRSHGTDVVAGVTPGKGGQDVEGIPVYDTVAEAVAEQGANTSLVFVPARFAADAVYEVNARSFGCRSFRSPERAAPGRRGSAVSCRRLQTSHGFHSPLMEPIVAELTRCAAGLPLAPPKIPFVSNVTGTWITEAEATASSTSFETAGSAVTVGATFSLWASTATTSPLLRSSFRSATLR